MTMSRLSLLPAAALLLHAAAVAATASVTASFGAQKGIAAPQTPGVTMDFWLHNDTSNGAKWGNNSILTADLNDVDLLAAASALEGGVLRVGGSPVDSVLYDVGGCTPGGGHGPSPDYYCSQVKPYVYGCLSPQRWEQIMDFADKTGLKLLMGINACHGRKTAASPMVFDNAKAFLEGTAALLRKGKGRNLIGFEFGNELVRDASNKTNHGVTALQYAADAGVLRGLIDETLGGERDLILVGPADEVGAGGAVARDVKKGVLRAITYHAYPMCPASVTNANGTFVFTPSCLRRLDDGAADMVADVAASSNPGLLTIAGETAEHYGGGVAGVNDGFEDIFYYAWQLATLPLNGVVGAYRQCLKGGDYELVDRVTGLPNPSYYVALLFKRGLPAAASLEVQMSVSEDQTGLRVFGFRTTAGKLAAVVVNTKAGGGDATVDLPAFAAGGSKVKVWVLSAPAGQPVHTRGLAVNGKTVVYKHGGGVPELPLADATLPLSVPSATVVFVFEE